MYTDDKSTETLDTVEAVSKDVINPKKNLTIFCHFSFKRPKGKEYGIFSVAFYWDFAGKKVITHKTRKYQLWEDHQFITAIQSYEHALLTIYELQGQMREAGIKHVMLVTDNSTLAGWIEDPKKNRSYTSWMEKAVKPYRTGSYKEIVIGVGLCEPRDAEKSYKYCKEENVENEYKRDDQKKVNVGEYRINVSNMMSFGDLIAQNEGKTDIVGMNTVD